MLGGECIVYCYLMIAVVVFVKVIEGFGVLFKHRFVLSELDWRLSEIDFFDQVWSLGVLFFWRTCLLGDGARG